MDVIGYLIMNKRGEYFGPGGWGDEKTARIFTAEDAVKMTRVFAPKVSAIRVHVTEYRAENTRALPEFEGVAA